MKKKIFAYIVWCSLFLLANSAWSLTIQNNGVDVGQLDILIGSTNLGNSGDDTELAWVRTVLGDPNISFEIKHDPIGNWYETDEAGVWAYELNYAPEYFLVKTGGKKDVDTHFLFQNYSDLNWAVVALSDLNITDFTIEGIDRISHLNEYNATAPVPEPGTLLLLGSGIAGLVAAKRRKKV